MNNDFTHDDFKAMKKALKLTNKNIAQIIGLTADSVKNQTQPANGLPSWARAMIYTFKTLTTTMYYITTSESFLSSFSIKNMGTAPILKNYEQNYYFNTEIDATNFIDSIKLWIRLNYTPASEPNFYILINNRGYLNTARCESVRIDDKIDHDNFLYFTHEIACKHFIDRLKNTLHVEYASHHGANPSL